MGEDLEYRICSEGHFVPYARWNFAKDTSDKDVDSNGLPMYEPGLYCHECDRAYGISKLKEPSVVE